MFFFATAGCVLSAEFDCTSVADETSKGVSRGKTISAEMGWKLLFSQHKHARMWCQFFCSTAGFTGRMALREQIVSVIDSTG